MSIFPKRLRAGGTVTIHTSRSLPLAGIVRVRTWVIDPRGKKTAIDDRIVALPPPPARLAEVERGPLHLVANAVVRGEQLFDVVDWFVRSTHAYRSYRVAPRAALGRYRVVEEIVFDGRRFGSGTAATDHFTVERLEVRGVIARGAGVSARLHNPGPEPLPVRIVERLRGGRDRDRRAVLKPRETRRIVCAGRPALVFWAEGREATPLAPGRGAWCVRSPEVTWQIDGDVVVIESARGVHRLDRTGAEIWLAAAGLRRRDEVRRRSNAKIYDRMLRRGLIEEIVW